MRLARLLSCALVLTALCACGPSASANADPPRCANTFVRAITSSEPTPGVWKCLSTSYQSRLQGEGDAVFALDVPWK